MIVLYTIDNNSREAVIKNMKQALKKKKLKQEFILLYCLDTRRVLRFTRHGMIYNSCGVVKSAGGLSISKSQKERLPSLPQQPPQTPPLTRRVREGGPFELCTNNVPQVIPSVSQQINRLIKENKDRYQLHQHYDLDESDHHSEISLDDIVDQNNTRLVFYNDDKEINTLYSCFYYKDQLIAVKPEFYERVKQEFDLTQIISVAELFGVREIMIHKVNIKDKKVTAGVNVETNGATQSVSLERTDYINENKTLRLTYDLAKSKFIFHTMKEFTNMLSHMSQLDTEDLPLSYSDLMRNVDLSRLISSRLEANMSSYDMDLRSVKKHSYGITLDCAYLTKCGFTIAKHDLQFNHLKIKLNYYNTEDLILSSNLILNRKCFEMIIKHSNLLNAYLENFLLMSSPREFFKYKIIKQLSPTKHRELISRVKVYSDLDLTTGSLLEELRGLSPTTMIGCNEDGLTMIQELYPYIYNFKRDPRLVRDNHSDCYNMRCSVPWCQCNQLKTIQIWIIRVFNTHSDRMLLVNSDNSRELYKTMFRIIINLRHIPTYDKFVKFILTELTPFIDEKPVDVSLARQNSFHSTHESPSTEV
jgi:hypothetical protein